MLVPFWNRQRRKVDCWGITWHFPNKGNHGWQNQLQLNSCNPNSYNSINHVIRTNFPVPSNFPIMYGNSYNSNNHVIRTNFSALWEFELHEFYCKSHKNEHCVNEMVNCNEDLKLSQPGISTFPQNIASTPTPDKSAVIEAHRSWFNVSRRDNTMYL